MKRSILLLALATVLGTHVSMAQTKQKPAKEKSAEKKGRGKRSPQEVAAQQAAQLQKKLGLSDETKTKVQALALTRIVANDSLRLKARNAQKGEEKKAIGEQIKANRNLFENELKAALSPEEQVKWKQLKEAHLKKKQEQKPAKLEDQALFED